MVQSGALFEGKPMTMTVRRKKNRRKRKERVAKAIRVLSRFDKELRHAGNNPQKRESVNWERTQVKHKLRRAGLRDLEPNVKRERRHHDCGRQHQKLSVARAS